MNNKLKYIVSLALVLIASSCKDDFLNVVSQDSITETGFFRTPDEIRRVTGAIYGSAWFDFNDKFSWCAGDGLPGDLLQDYQDEGQLFFMSFTANNTVILQGWRGLYRVIAASNSVINDMPSIAKGYGVAQKDIDSGVAEARFLRGVAYFYLAEYWDEVPLIENGAAVVNSGNLMLPKNDKQSVYEFVRRDLEYAKDNLPLSDAPGRVTQWSAKGMLAKLHLTMASDLADANSSANFAKAKEYAADVIENSGLTLMAKYEDLFKVANNNNPESLFAIQFTAGSYGVGNSHQAVMARGTNLTGISEGWGGFKSLTVDYIDNLIDNTRDVPNGPTKEDLRRKSIYMWLGDYYPEIHKAYGGYTYNIYKKYPADYPDPLLAGSTEGAAPVLNNVKKYVLGTADDVGVSISNQATPINMYVLRLADVYLIYTEATMGAGSQTTDPTALNYFNKVRTRGGLNPRTVVTYDNLFNERRVEFGMEAINWFDVKRRFYRENKTIGDWFLNNGAVRNTRYVLIDNSADDIARNTLAAYERQAPTSPVVPTVEHMRLPIPNQEVTANPQLAPEVEAVPYVFK